MSDGASRAGAGNGISKPTFHFIAGLGSGTSSAILLQPIDLLKTRVQQSGHHSLRAAFREIRQSPAATGLFPALWRGTVPSALRTGFGSAIYFTGLNAIRQNATRISFLAAAGEGEEAGGGNTAAGGRYSGGGGARQHSSSLVKLSNTGNLLAGAVARAGAGFILMPLTVIKVRYESNLYSYRSIVGAGRDIFRGEGVRGFFAGFGATAIRDAPYAGLYVLFYEQCKKRLSALHIAGQQQQQQQAADAAAGTGRTMGVSRAAAINFSSGALAATICSVVSNPFDAVKTRIQLQPAGYRNMAHAARRMLTEEGLRSLWDGLALRMSRKAMSSALAWTVYEELIRRAEGSWGGATRKSESVL